MDLGKPVLAADMNDTDSNSTAGSSFLVGISSMAGVWSDGSVSSGNIFISYVHK